MAELFTAIPTADFAVGRAWWERFFDRPPDLVPNDNEACWRVTDHGWIYVIGDAERAGKGLATLLVDDFDAWVERLRLTEIKTMPGGIRSSLITDPEGNTLQLGG
jgi:hypothetical protein